MTTEDKFDGNPDYEGDEKWHQMEKAQRQMKQAYLDGVPAMVAVFTTTGQSLQYGHYHHETMQFVWQIDSGEWRRFYVSQVDHLLAVVGTERIIGQVFIQTH